MASVDRLLAASSGVPDELADDAASRVDGVAVLTRPSQAWLPGNPRHAREALLVRALVALSGETRAPVGATVAFEHPLAVFDRARRRFNVGPFDGRGAPDTVFASDGSRGSVFRAVFDVGDWNRSVAANAPGQSGSPASPHYDDLAHTWAQGDDIPLVFDTGRIAADSAETLTLNPR